MNNYQNQDNLSSEELFNMLENPKNGLNLTNEEEKILLEKFLEFSKFFNKIKSEMYKNKKQSEEKAKNHYE